MNMPGYVQAEDDEELRQQLRQVLTTQASRHLTVCEQLRFVYDDVAQLPAGELKESMTNKLVDAMNMCKKMNDRLVYYKKKEGKYSGSSGAHLISLQHTKRRKRLRTERETSNL